MYRLVLIVIVGLGLQATARGQAAQTSFYLPQVVIGGGQTTADGRVQTGWEFVLRRMNKSSVSQISRVTFRLFTETGQLPSYQIFVKSEGGEYEPQPIVPSGEPLDSFTHIETLQPNQTLATAYAVMPESAYLRIGWIGIGAEPFRSADSPPPVVPDPGDGVVVSAMFRLYENGRVVSQVGVPAVESRLENNIHVFVAEQESQSAGIAFSNPYNEDVIVRTELLTADQTVVIKELTLPKYAHISKFITELMPEFSQHPDWATKKTFQGRMKITARARTNSQPRSIPVLALDTRTVPGVGFFMSTLPAR